MPIYEYYCADCQTKFEALRSMSQSDDPIQCSKCSGQHTSRTMSLFAAFSSSSSGQKQAVTSSGHSCGSCHGGSCSHCGG